MEKADLAIFERRPILLSNVAMAALAKPFLTEIISRRRSLKTTIATSSQLQRKIKLVKLLSYLGRHADAIDGEITYESKCNLDPNVREPQLHWLPEEKQLKIACFVAHKDDAHFNIYVEWVLDVQKDGSFRVESAETHILPLDDHKGWILEEEKTIEEAYFLPEEILDGILENYERDLVRRKD